MTEPFTVHGRLAEPVGRPSVRDLFMATPLPPTEREAIRYYRGDEPEYLAMKARWDADRAALIARWRRVYDPVLAAAPTAELHWAIKHHKPVFGYSNVGMPPRLPHCDCCTWGPENEPEDWPCDVFRDLRAEVVRQRKR